MRTLPAGMVFVSGGVEAADRSGRLPFRQRSSSNQAFFFNTARLMSATGLSASSANPPEADTGRLNFLFAASPVPESAPTLLFGVGLAALQAHRRRSGAKARRN